jgi:hypothetical protein
MIANIGISTRPFGLPIPEKMFGRPPNARGAIPKAPAVPDTGGIEPMLEEGKGGAGGRPWNGPVYSDDGESRYWRIWRASDPNNRDKLGSACSDIVDKAPS